MDFNATFTRRLFIPHPRIAGKQAEKEQDDLYHFKQKNSNISVNCLALAVCLCACHTNNFRRSLTFIFHITFLDEKKTETCEDIATVGIIFLKEREEKKNGFLYKMRHAQNSAIQEGVWMLKRKATLFTWVLFHDNNF